MRLIDSGRPGARASVALDAALFQALDAGGTTETLRIWEADEPAVIAGSFGAIDREVHEEACLADGVPVIRRSSGGGAVVVGRGCLNYTLVLSLEDRPALRDVPRSYAAILGRLAEAIGLPRLAVAGVSDLALGNRKVGGSAQRRGRRALLHHGTVLYGFDVSLMERYLREPRRQPPYRAGRRHAAFVTNVPMGPAALKAALVGGFLGSGAGSERSWESGAVAGEPCRCPVR